MTSSARRRLRRLAGQRVLRRALPGGSRFAEPCPARLSALAKKLSTRLRRGEPPCAAGASYGVLLQGASRRQARHSEACAARQAAAGSAERRSRRMRDLL